MNRDPLIELLRRADEAAARPALKPNLGATVLNAARMGEDHFRVVAVLTLTAAAAAAALTISIRLPSGDDSSRQPIAAAAASGLSAADVARLRAEITCLDRKADALMTTTRRTTTLRRWTEPSVSDNRPVADVRADAHTQFDSAACLAVMQAARLEATSAEFAVAAYREVVDVFPNTTWADQARRRLLELDSQAGGSS